MSDVPAELSSALTGRSRRGRLVRLLVAVLAIAAVGGAAARIYDEPIRVIRAAARDYLTVNRLRRHTEILRTAASESGVDPHLLAGIVAADSGGRVDVVSPRGAMGLFQLSRVTATWRAEFLGLPPPTDQELLSDPLLNARLGADNMAWLLDTYDGDELRALCAYNAGAHRLKGLVDEEGGWQAWREKHERAQDSGILAYANRVLRYRTEFRQRGLFDGN